MNLESRKSLQPGFSLALFSESLGFGSRNYLSLILSGKRDLTISNIHRIAKALGLNFQETNHFECLVHLEQSSDEPERRYYTRRLREARESKPESSARILPKAMFEKWYYPVILVALDRCSKNEGLQKLARLLPFPAQELEQVLNYLMQTELLREEGGVFHLNSSHQIFFDLKSSSVKHKRFLQSQLDRSHQALQKSYGPNAKFYSHTFSIAESDFNYYESRLRELLSEFTRRSDESPNEDIVQLNMQLFRVAALL